MPRVLQGRKRVLARDAVGVEVVGVLEGADGVMRAGSRRPVDDKWVAVRIAVAKFP
jgi:hypothetical protein